MCEMHRASQRNISANWRAVSRRIGQPRCANFTMSVLLSSTKHPASVGMVLPTDSQPREHPQHFMKRILVYVTLSLLYASFAVAQQSATSAVSQAGPVIQHSAPELQQNVPGLAPPRLDVVQSIRVTSTVEPLPLAESDRSVEVLSPSELSGEHNSVVDLLRVDPSLNVQARAGEGVQADLSLRGTTFEQSLVLVNGLRVNDPETGHLNLDIPVPLDAVTRVDILHGSGSTFYGSDAIGGAMNLLTGPPAPGLII